MIAHTLTTTYITQWQTLHYIKFVGTFHLPAVPSVVKRETSKGNSIGQSISGSNTLAHNSTMPTPSETLKKVCSKPTTATAGNELWLKAHTIKNEYAKLCPQQHIYHKIPILYTHRLPQYHVYINNVYDTVIMCTFTHTTTLTSAFHAEGPIYYS